MFTKVTTNIHMKSIMFESFFSIYMHFYRLYWYVIGRIDDFLMILGFTKSKVDSNLYYNVEDEGIMILLLYVDDLFLTGKEKLISECKKNLATKFEMKDLGMMHYFLGLEV